MPFSKDERSLIREVADRAGSAVRRIRGAVGTARSSGRGPRRSLHEGGDTAELVVDALDRFRAEYPDLRLEDVAVVIAAYNEEGNIGPVLDEVPAELAGLGVSRLVVVDGGSDGTPDEARAHGALVCELAANCGHGVALRLGYHIARGCGSKYIATLDGDGQWNPADLPGMIDMLERGQADMVIGSRQLGSTENTDALRNTGVRFFSKVISRLTGTKLTDTSSGLRAMEAGLTGVVPQTQPQYQTSELLIGAIYHGYRVAEVPTTMRPRLSGETKKGHNVLYGARYARVIFHTWRRERRRAADRRRAAPGPG